VENRAHYIQERFPDKKHQINRLLSENSEFLALSEDYDLCVTALQYWAGSTAPEAETRVIEYHTLIKELEGEISQYFNCI
jgi:HEPN domain-containing protein